jgi:hypothetical protein
VSRLQAGERELRHREDGGVVAGEVRKEERRDFLVGRRGVDVAAPDPLRASRSRGLAERRGLRVVHDEHVVRLLEQLRALAVHVQVDGLVRLGQRVRGSLQRVVKGLGDPEELGRALDQSPVRVDAEGLREGHETRQELGHAAAEPRGIDVADPDTFQVARQRLDLVDDLVADDAAVVVDVRERRAAGPMNGDFR